GVVTRERLVCTRIVVAPLENHLASGVDNRAPALGVAAQRGGIASGVTDDNLLTVLPEQLCSDWYLHAAREAEDGLKRELVIALHDVCDTIFLLHDGLWWANALEC